MFSTERTSPCPTCRPGRACSRCTIFRPGWTAAGTTPPTACGGGRPLLIGLGIATMILTDSEAVRRQAIDYFRINPARVAAVPLAASDKFRPVPAPPPERPFFLYVGTLEPRKNIPFLIEAWRPLRGAKRRPRARRPPSRRFSAAARRTRTASRRRSSRRSAARALFAGARFCISFAV